MNESAHAGLVTVNAAARRHGMDNGSLRLWLENYRAAGFPVPERPESPGGKWFVSMVLVERLLAWRSQVETLRQASSRVGVYITVLSRLLTESGVPRAKHKPWLIERSLVDQVIAARRTSLADAADSRAMIDVNCLQCGLKFTKKRRYEQERLHRGAAGPFCGQRCANNWAATGRERARETSPVPCRDEAWVDESWFDVAKRSAARFWSHVDRSGSCWPWQAGSDKDGYGKFTITLPRIGKKQRQINIRAHRLAYILTQGPVPREVLVRHTCDTPACCNPDHLLTGTQADNVADRVARGRSAVGNLSGARTKPHVMAAAARKRARKFIWEGSERTLAEIALLTGQSRTLLTSRVNRGLSIADAATLPKYDVSLRPRGERHWRARRAP
jgi:hypothetical protein